jgi:hypothetical protein
MASGSFPASMKCPPEQSSASGTFPRSKKNVSLLLGLYQMEHLCHKQCVDRAGSLLQSHIGQKLWMRRVRYDQVVADRTIVGNAYAPLGTMIAVVATKTAGRVTMSNIVGMCAPGDLH